MPMECSPALFDFAPVEGRRVVAAFDGGAITSNAGALLLGATDRAISLVEPLRRLLPRRPHARAGRARHRDARRPARLRHSARTRGSSSTTTNSATIRCWPCSPASSPRGGVPIARRLAGKSTLNRLEHAPDGAPGRYHHKIGHDRCRDRAAVRRPLSRGAPQDRGVGRSSSISTPPTIPCMGIRKAASSTATTTATAICRSTSSAAGISSPPSCGARTSMPPPAQWRRSSASSPDPRALAAGADPAARRQRLCPRGADGLVRAQPRRLPVRPREERPPRRRDRARACRGASRGTATGRPARRFNDFRWSTRDSWSRRRRIVARPSGRAARPTRASSSPRSNPPKPRRATLRGGLLRPRRDGEPHQGVPGRSLRRPHLGGHHAGQPVAAMVRLDGLCPAVRAAPHRLAPHRVRRGDLRHASASGSLKIGAQV